MMAADEKPEPLFDEQEQELFLMFLQECEPALFETFKTSQLGLLFTVYRDPFLSWQQGWLLPDEHQGEGAR